MPVSKKTKIKRITNKLLKDSIPHMKDLIKKALDSGALDLEKWDEKLNHMIIPKSIFIAVLKVTADQYSSIGTSFEKEMTKDINNLKCFL